MPSAACAAATSAVAVTAGVVAATVARIAPVGRIAVEIAAVLLAATRTVPTVGATQAADPRQQAGAIVRTLTAAARLAAAIAARLATAFAARLATRGARVSTLAAAAHVARTARSARATQAHAMFPPEPRFAEPATV